MRKVLKRTILKRVTGCADAEADALRVEIDVLGEGVPVVFLHGLLGLKEHFRPIAEAIDGVARSYMFQSPLLELRGGVCSIESAAKLTLDAVEEAIGEPAVFVGNSFGGHIALHAAVERPEMVRGLVLAGAAGLLERSEDIEEISRGIREVQHRPSREWLDRKISELFYDQSAMPEGVIDRAYEVLSQRRAARAFVRLSRSSKADHFGDRLAAIRTPTLVLWGREDIVTPPSAALEFHEGIRGSRLVWIDECGHAPMIEKPDRFADALGGFLESLVVRTPANGGTRQEVA